MQQCEPHVVSYILVNFATLEIKSLVLLKKVKAKISEDDVNIGNKTESDEKDSQKKTVKKVKKLKKAKIVDPFKNLQKKSFDCPYCDKTYDASTIKSLQFHCRKHHPDQPKILKKDFE